MTNEITILDGATGTILQQNGLLPGQLPEVFGCSHPEVLEQIHRAYVDAGSTVVYANTFGANRHKLAGSGLTVARAVGCAVAAARRAAAGRARVALDVGPIGQLLQPLGTLPFDEACDIYREMVEEGQRAGADLVVFETFTDLCDLRAAVLAAKEHSTLPVWATMSFGADGRTFTGTSVSAMALTIGGLGVQALGINCSLGPDEIYPLAAELVQWTDLPVIVKPNAGLPDPATGRYTVGPAAFAQSMARYPALGVAMVGGCCGTTPDYIRLLAPLKDAPLPRRAAPVRRGVCSASKTVELNGVRVIGERLNPTGKKRFQQALREQDMDYILKTAIDQEAAGADILDVNVGLPGLDEGAMMARLVDALQPVVSLPLQIDSSDPAVIGAGLRRCCGRAVVNSVNGKAQVLDAVLPLVKKYGAAVIGLTIDENGLPRTAADRLDIARRICRAADRYGIPREDVIIDCLTMTVSAQQDQAAETLEALRLVKSELGVRCALGVSNISFGLPERQQISQSFLTQALCCGLDLPILNPNQTAMMDAVCAARVLSGEDKGCAAYIRRFSGAPARPAAAETAEAGLTIAQAVALGLRDETAALTRALLEHMSELEAINTQLIPALDAVGDRYEKQEIFLPQLINSANAACAGFELIKARIAQRGGSPVARGKIAVATVQGDIHDIGKNIVKVILENYGYQVVDLGRDVPPGRVVQAVAEQHIGLVGLSALMTTTVPAMAETIRQLKRDCPWCRVWVGGAVLTQDYAAQIGADFYAADARRSVDIARKVLGE